MAVSRKWMVGAVSVAFLLSTAPLGLAGAPQPEARSLAGLYDGKIRSDAQAEVSLRVQRSGRVTFRVKRLQLFCGDESRVRRTFDAARGRLHDDGSFEVHASSAEPRTNFQTFVWARGVIEKRRATGKVFGFFNPGAPLGGATVSCSTFGESSWKASRS